MLFLPLEVYQTVSSPLRDRMALVRRIAIGAMLVLAASGFLAGIFAEATTTLDGIALTPLTSGWIGFRCSAGALHRWCKIAKRTKGTYSYLECLLSAEGARKG
jgi:hypothetical protein